MFRRTFLSRSTLAGAALSLPGSRVLGANNDIRVAIIGCGGKGRSHSKMFHEMEGTRVVALCDPDIERQKKALSWFRKQDVKVPVYADLREVLDRKDIDAVVVATANQWHALAMIWACQAGKDVYVEKPVSWSVWEGKQMVAAARKYQRIVQAGTQQRSEFALRDNLVDYVQAGELGKILWAHGVIWKPRQPIPARETPGLPTEPVDYNLWCGPSPMVPLKREKLHYDWHWNWRTGNGDMGNLGVHQFDVCRWFCGYDDLPRRVLSLGGRFTWTDAGQAPNTQMAIFDYEGAPIYFSVRTLPTKPGSPEMDHLRGARSSNLIQCEHGYVLGGWESGLVYDNQGKLIKKVAPDGGGTHQANFIKAVRSRNPADLHAEIREGHISSASCELINISQRIGNGQSPEAIREQTKGIADADQAVEKFIEHVGRHVDLKKEQITLGPWLEIDRTTQTVTGSHAAAANAQLRRAADRQPFVVPEIA